MRIMTSGIYLARLAAAEMQVVSDAYVRIRQVLFLWEKEADSLLRLMEFRLETILISIMSHTKWDTNLAPTILLRTATKEQEFKWNPEADLQSWGMQGLPRWMYNPILTHISTR